MTMRLGNGLPANLAGVPIHIVDTTTNIAALSGPSIDGFIAYATDTRTLYRYNNSIPTWQAIGQNSEFVCLTAYSMAAPVQTGDGQAWFTVPARWNGYKLVAAEATVATASSSGLPTIQIANVSRGWDMLSTRITIDTSENTSLSAATLPVIDTSSSHDQILAGNLIRVDIDVAGTGTKGWTVNLEFAVA